MRCMRSAGEAEHAAFGSTTRRVAFPCLVLAVAAALAAGCGGKKRPPAVATAPPLAKGPEGHTQRLLTVVKAGSIQDVKAVPGDKK